MVVIAIFIVRVYNFIFFHNNIILYILILPIILILNRNFSIGYYDLFFSKYCTIRSIYYSEHINIPIAGRDLNELYNP